MTGNIAQIIWITLKILDSKYYKDGLLIDLADLRMH